MQPTSFTSPHQRGQIDLQADDPPLWTEYIPTTLQDRDQYFTVLNCSKSQAATIRSVLQSLQTKVGTVYRTSHTQGTLLIRRAV